MGNIVATLLTDYSMPIIRYEIGDSGALTNKKCSCGRGMPMLKSVNGRTIDIFKTATGEKIYGDYFTHLFYTEKDVKQFQVIQHSYEKIEVKIVFFESVTDKEQIYKRISDNIRKIMGNNVMIEFSDEKDIPVSKSGKRIYTISYVKEI